MCLAFNQAANAVSFPSESLEALIVTLPKPGKLPTTPLNFKPISLLNSDLKIYAKIIASRLDHLLLALIHPNQVVFIRSRQAPDG